MRGNPIRTTVRRFIGPQEMREWRAISKQAHKAKQPVKSNFVRFMESLENRGGIPKIGREDFYRKWTCGVRQQMEKAGTWPKPEENTNLKILAEYLSRLQAFFWKEFPKDKWNEINWFDEVYHLDSKFRPHRRVLKKFGSKSAEKACVTGRTKCPNGAFIIQAMHGSWPTTTCEVVRNIGLIHIPHRHQYRLSAIMALEYSFHHKPTRNRRAFSLHFYKKKRPRTFVYGPYDERFIPPYYGVDYSTIPPFRASLFMFPFGRD